MEEIVSIFEVPELLQQFVIAVAIGSLIGVEREKEPSDKFAGLRTLALLCGTGPIMVYYSAQAGYPVLVSIYLVLAAIFAISIAYIRFTIVGEEIGFTTSVTVFFVALLGVLVGYGSYIEATSIAIIATFLLAEKRMLVGFVDKLTYREITDAIKVGALVFVLYPILPSEAIDPYGVVNLREVLVFAIFVLMIEFSAYVSMRYFGGSKGLQVTGILAGMANSFATAGVMARMANKSRNARDAASSGIMLSVISMVVRNVGLASIIALALFWTVWVPAVAMIFLAIGIAAYLLKTSDNYDELDINIDSPFSFSSAAKFSVIYIAITVVSVVSQQYLGDVGLYATAYTGGLISSAAVAVSAATVYNQGTVGAEVAGGMVLLGILASLTSKIVLVELINGSMTRKATVPMAAVGVVGLVVYAII